MCTTSPSIIAYSNGGNLLAVATGKVIRVYNMTRLDFHSVEGTGSPSLIFAAAESGGYHSYLTAVRFVSNDVVLLTSSSDGYLYSWNLQTSARIGDYCMRGYETRLLFCGMPSTITTYGRSLGKHSKGLDISSLQSSMELAVALRPVETESPDISTAPYYLAIWRTIKSSKAIHAVTSPKRSDGHPNRSAIHGGYDSFLADPTLIRFDHAVTCGASSWVSDGIARQEMCALGFDDGQIIVSTLPLALSPLDSTASISAKKLFTLKETSCRRLKLTKARVAEVAFSSSGHYIFAANADGSVFIFALSATTFSHSMLTSLSAGSSLPEFKNNYDNSIMMVDRESYRSVIHRLENHREILQSVQENCSNQLSQMENQVKDLQLQSDLKLKNEMSKRDALISQLKSEISKLTESLKSSQSSQELNFKRMLSDLEVDYDKKLQHSQLELAAVKQAYEEHFVHLKHELAEKEAQSMQAARDIQGENDRILNNMRSQQEVMNMYYQYLNDRHSEVFQGFEDAQAQELEKHNSDLKLTREALQEQALRLKSTTAHYQTQCQRLIHENKIKEEEIIKLKADLITIDKKLQHARADCDVLRNEVSSSAAASEHWEDKAKSLSQEVTLLERSRKTLNAQLLELRQQVHPNEIKISQISESMAELDSECMQLMQRNRDLSRSLDHISNTNSSLTKQLRDLRKQCSSKDSSLKRAAKLMSDYKIAMTRRQNSSMTGKDDESFLLERIDEILRQYIPSEVEFSSGDKVDEDNDAEVAKFESERHVHYLHASIQGLQKNLNHSKAVAIAEVRSRYLRLR